MKKKMIKLLVISTIFFIMSMIATVNASALTDLISETESNNTASTANVMTLGETNSDGAVVNRSYLSYSGDVDFFTFTAPRHGRLEITFSSHSSNNYICQVLDSSHNVLKTISVGSSDSIITLKTQTLPVYYLKVSSNSSSYSTTYQYSIIVSYVTYAEYMWDTPLAGMYMNATSFTGYDTAAYGEPYHLGSDFATSDISGASVYSMCSGTVIQAGYSDSMGYYVIIRSDDIDSYTGNPFTIRYMHLLESPLVSKNDIVESGTIIGKVGNTGASSGTHLHIDINTAGYTSGTAMRNDKESVVNVIDFFALDIVYISGDIY